MNVDLSQFNLSRAVFLDKVTTDLQVGVRLKAGAESDKDVIRVWTDARNWQFSVMGLINFDGSIEIVNLEIQSFGSSLKYIKLSAETEKVDLGIYLQKLSPNFAELSEVKPDDAKQFFDGYMSSTVNRTMTEKLFKEFVDDKEQVKWVEF